MSKNKCMFNFYQKTSNVSKINLEEDQIRYLSSCRRPLRQKQPTNAKAITKKRLQNLKIIAYLSNIFKVNKKKLHFGT